MNGHIVLRMIEVMAMDSVALMMIVHLMLRTMRMRMVYVETWMNVHTMAILMAMEPMTV